MKMEKFNQLLLESVGVGLAILERDGREILFGNRRFAEWFPGESGIGQTISKIKELEYMIESYSSMVEKRNRRLEREKQPVEKLLLNIMPKTVYEELKTFGVTAPQKYEQASVLMLDFVGFTDMAISEDPAGFITELNDIFTAFDRIAEQFGCERIKTMGDAYMAVSGIPEASPDHAQNIAKVTLLMVR